MIDISELEVVVGSVDTDAEVMVGKEVDVASWRALRSKRALFTFGPACCGPGIGEEIAFKCIEEKNY